MIRLRFCPWVGPDRHHPPRQQASGVMGFIAAVARVVVAGAKNGRDFGHCANGDGLTSKLDEAQTLVADSDVTMDLGAQSAPRTADGFIRPLLCPPPAAMRTTIKHAISAASRARTRPTVGKH